MLHALHVSNHSVYDLNIFLLVAMEAIAVKLFDKLLVLLSDKVHVSCIVAMVTRVISPVRRRERMSWRVMLYS